MFSPKLEIETQDIKVKYERHPESIFSVPKTRETIYLINQIMDEIFESSLNFDFKGNINSNNENESLINHYYEHLFKLIECNIKNKNYSETLCVLNAIFFVLENLDSWNYELENNYYKEFIENLCFYFNHTIIAVIFYFNFSIYDHVKQKYKNLIESIKTLINEIHTFSHYLTDNFNLKPIGIFHLNEFYYLLNSTREDIIGVSLMLIKLKIDLHGYLLGYFPKPENHELFEDFEDFEDFEEKDDNNKQQKCDKFSN